jgi:glycosyltransferase involved in cell wall biosynthesis
MPCLNEPETIAQCIGKAKAFFAQARITGEILIADNGSKDGSQAIAESLGARVIHVARRGYGSALIGGIEAARGTYIIMGDADDSYDFLGLAGFVEKLRGGADLVMGNRFRGGIAAGAMPPLHRYLGNPVLSLVGRILYNLPIGDFHCGLRGFNTASIRRLGLVTPGMEFASEMVLRTGIAGYEIVEVPTTLKPDGRSRPPHLKSFRDGWRHLKLLLMYCPLWLFFYPGVALIVIGLLLATLLFGGPLAIGPDLVLDINTFVAACFMVISGSQVVTFGVTARYYATATGMLPRGRRSRWLEKHLTTDMMARLAAVLLVGGLATFAIAAHDWARVGFGDLSGPVVPRTVVAGLSLIVIGMQVGFQAFFVGVLRIPLEDRPARQDLYRSTPEAEAEAIALRVGD